MSVERAAGQYAAVTLLTTDSYVLGANVVGFSLRETGWSHPLVAMVTASVSENGRRELARYWDRIIDVEPIASPNADDCWDAAVGDYTRLRVWTLTEFEKLVFIDADTVVLGPIEELLERPSFAASPCLWPPDRFNGGVLVIDPSQETFDSMMRRIGSIPSYDGGDQGFLNAYFSDWFTGPPEHRLPTIFNASQFLYLYDASWRLLRDDIRVLHFTGPRKPWKNKGALRRRLWEGILARFMPVGPRPSPHELWWKAHDRMTASERQG